jgi:sugar phosphate isomerase/epimerase
MQRQWSRRTFLTRVAGFASLLGSVKGAQPAILQVEAKATGPRLGGPIFVKTEDPVELAQAHRKLGYRAAYCPEVKLEDSQRIRAIADAFSMENVVIAEVGRWVNLLDADPEKRRANLKQVTDGLALAEAIGARCCVDIAGSFNPTSWFGPNPENLSKRFFDAAVENARTIIDAVKPKRAKFCYEMMGWSLPDGPDSNLELLHAVDRKSFGVHLDPCNLVNSPKRFYQNADLLKECFDKLGPWIVSCHAKDLVWDVEMNIHFREVRPGAGSMDYRTYLSRLAGLGRDVTLMIEHLPNAAEYDRARTYLLDLGRNMGITW